VLISGDSSCNLSLLEKVFGLIIKQNCGEEIRNHYSKHKIPFFSIKSVQFRTGWKSEEPKSNSEQRKLPLFHIGDKEMIKELFTGIGSAIGKTGIVFDWNKDKLKNIADDSLKSEGLEMGSRNKQRPQEAFSEEEKKVYSHKEDKEEEKVSMKTPEEVKVEEDRMMKILARYNKLTVGTSEESKESENVAEEKKDQNLPKQEEVEEIKETNQFKDIEVEKAKDMSQSNEKKVNEEEDQDLFKEKDLSPSKGKDLSPSKVKDLSPPKVKDLSPSKNNDLTHLKENDLTQAKEKNMSQIEEKIAIPPKEVEESEETTTLDV